MVGTAAVLATSRMAVVGDMGRFSDEVLSRIARAKRRVDVECFIVRADQLGRSLAEALAAATSRGVPCRLLYDPLGSRKTPRSYFQALAARGVVVRQFGWVGALVVGRLTGKPAARDHARVVVVDDVGYTGGHAWGAEWLPTARGGEGWHDVCCAVEGPIVEDFATLFEQHWRQARGETGISDFVGEVRDGLRLVSDAPVKDSIVLGRYVEAIRAARQRVWLANAYFFPPPVLLEALLAASRRGVDVKVIVPGVSDVPFIQYAARAHYRRWMAAGLELWEYQQVVMHSKYAIVDDSWCLIGTFNANVVSVAFAIEVALVSRLPADTSQAAAQLVQDLAASRVVDEHLLAQVGFLGRAFGHLAAFLILVANLIFWRRPVSLPDDRR